MVTDLTVALKLDTTDWETKLKGAEERAEQFVNVMKTMSKDPVDLSNLIIPPNTIDVDLSQTEEELQGLTDLVHRITRHESLTYLQTNVEHLSLRFHGTRTRNLGISELVETEISPNISDSISREPIHISDLNLDVSETQVIDLGTRIQKLLHSTVQLDIPETFNIEFSQSVDRLQKVLETQSGGGQSIRELSDNILSLKDSTMTLVQKLRE